MDRNSTAELGSLLTILPLRPHPSAIRAGSACLLSRTAVARHAEPLTNKHPTHGAEADCKKRLELPAPVDGTEERKDQQHRAGDELRDHDDRGRRSSEATGHAWDITAPNVRICRDARDHAV